MIHPKEPFERAAKKIYDRWGRKIYGTKLEKMEEQFKRLYLKGSVQEYYVRIWARTLELIFAGTVILSILAVFSAGKGRLWENYQIRRPAYGEQSMETEVSALIEGEKEKIQIPVTVEARRYTDRQIEEIFNTCKEQLPEMILGENESLDRIQKELKLPTFLENGTVEVNWFLEPTDYINEEGKLEQEPPKEGILIEFKAVLRCQSKEQELRFFGKLYPQEKTYREELKQRLSEEIRKEAEKNPGGEQILFPKTLEGKKIWWMTPQIPVLPIGILFLLLLAWYLLTRDEKELKKRMEFRRRQMIMDYPMILYKMSMLLGAGMTIQGAFSRIACYYREKGDGTIRYAYEEMLNICLQMENGLGEAAAYEQFGQNCQDMRYIKLGSILSQNLKKGSKGLSELLLKEARQGMEERKNLAKKVGEEAAVKMLLPMMLMLVLVMAILVIPSVLAF